MPPWFEKSNKDTTGIVTVHTNNDFTDGYIRVEPPIFPIGDYMENVGSEASILLSGGVSSSEATILDYEISNDPIESRNNRERLEATVDQILGDLALIASRELFKKQ
jgi:hypothetical protein